MNHLTTDDLSSRVRWDQTPEGLKVRLFLKLSGPDSNNLGRTIELTRALPARRYPDAGQRADSGNMAKFQGPGMEGLLLVLFDRRCD
jgi:hypothetical protein